MKKVMLIGGIVLIVAGVISLLLGVFFRHAYYNVLDGSSELYARLHNRMIVFFIIGAVMAVAGTLCAVFHTKV